MVWSLCYFCVRIIVKAPDRIVWEQRKNPVESNRYNKTIVLDECGSMCKQSGKACGVTCSYRMFQTWSFDGTKKELQTSAHCALVSTNLSKKNYDGASNMHQIQNDKQKLSLSKSDHREERIICSLESPLSIRRQAILKGLVQKNKI